MKKFAIIFILLSKLSFFAQENFQQNLITYRKTIISPTFNLVLKNNSEIEVLNKKATDFSKNITFPTSTATIATFNEKIWIANDKNIEVLDIKNSKKIKTIEIPSGITISQMVIGFNDVAFLVDNQKNAIYSLINDEFNLLVEDARIKQTTSILIIGGELFIGTNNSILSFSISKKTISVFAENLNVVLDLETDYLMQIIALTNKQVLRFDTKKEATTLIENNQNYISFSMNPENQKLYLLDNKNKITTSDYSKLVKISVEALKKRSQ
jgi:hypothetical protein